jgi:threonylcarbamoyladenosine tRNA methylthiotransferase CDKAL1
MKIYLESYGCTLNKSETGLYANKLLSEGAVITQNPDEADLRLIGTCVVIEHTEERMLRRIAELSTKGKVQVMGCLSTVSAGSIESENIKLIGKSEFRSFYKGSLDDIEIRDASIFDGIPINQGCTGSCNFCISRVARGSLISRPIEKIKGQAKIQLDHGIREIRLSSLDSAAYGKDLGTSLDALIESVSSIEDDFRIRVGMMEPSNTASILRGLLRSYSSDKVYKFLHLPVQSGDDRILETMNRGYHADTFDSIVKAFRTSFKDSTLSTDIITGYYGESEESFENTVKLIEKTEPEIINITRYSPRPYTPDYDRKAPPTNDVKRWTSYLTNLHHELAGKRMQTRVGKLCKILITEHGKNETSVGRDQAYRPIVIPGRHDLYSFLDCEIVGFTDTYAIAKIV